MQILRGEKSVNFLHTILAPPVEEKKKRMSWNVSYSNARCEPDAS